MVMKPSDSAGLQDVRILPQQLRVVMVDNGHEEVLVLAESGFDAADHHAAVGIADFRGDDADRECALLAQRTGEEVRVIIEFARRGDNAVLGVLGNGFRVGRIVQDRGNRALGQSQVFGQFLEGGSAVIG